MVLVTLGGMKRDAACPEHLYHVEVVELIGNGEGKYGEVREWPPRFQADRCRVLLLFPECPLADNVAVVVEQFIDGVDAQVGHAQVVRVRVNQGDGQPAPPVLDNGALFAREDLPCIFEFIPGHFYIIQSYQTKV
jgi:hypothetical protein